MGEVLTDEQLMLLEQMTYIKERVYDEAGISYVEPRSMKQMVEVFDETALRRLEEAGDISYTDGSEWAAIIRAIQADEDLMRLELTAHEPSQHIFCFEDPERNG